MRTFVTRTGEPEGAQVSNTHCGGNTDPYFPSIWRRFVSCVASRLTRAGCVDGAVADIFSAQLRAHYAAVLAQPFAVAIDLAAGGSHANAGCGASIT